MKRTVTLMAAPVGMQPGPYLATAYADAWAPLTESVEVQVDAAPRRIELRWRAPQPARDLAQDPARFVDACALLTPENGDAPWITMGAPETPVVGVLWRADRAEVYHIRAEGFGTVVRGAPPAGWAAEAEWSEGVWTVRFALPDWPALEKARKFAVAVWRGADRQRAGLKSVTTDWLPIEGA